MREKILVTGSTGNVGTYLVENLINRKSLVKAAGSNIERIKSAFGDKVEAVEFDFENQDTFERALDGVSKVFLLRPPAISNVNKYIKPFIDKCVEKKIEQIVFLSLLGIEKNPFPPHYKIEKLIKKSGISYTFLRPSFFMQNLNTTHQYDIKEKNDIFIPAGKAKVSFIDTRDIGEVAAECLINDIHKNREYTLTGQTAIDYFEVAEIFTEILGRKIIYSNPSPLKFRNELIKRGVDKKFANIVMILYITTRMGMANKVTNDVEMILRRKPKTIKEYILDYESFWTKNE